MSNNVVEAITDEAAEGQTGQLTVDRPLRSKQIKQGALTLQQATQVPEPSEIDQEPVETDPKKVRFTTNRELSWLKFNERCLAESTDAALPLFERCNFLAIFTSNLDEFFMIRVGSLHDLSLLKKPPVDNKSLMTPDEQLSAIFEACKPLYQQRDQSFAEVESKLAEQGICRYRFDDLAGNDLKAAEEYANKFVLPVLSPQIIDAHHPFPHLSNGTLYVVVKLKRKKSRDLVGLIPIPSSLDRCLYFKSGKLSYILVEDIILHYAEEIFSMYKVTEKSVIRVTRNADINPDDEVYDDDLSYRAHMKKILKKRPRLAPVRLEVQHGLSDDLQEYFCEHLNISSEQIFISGAPLELSYTYEVSDHLSKDISGRLFNPPFEPQTSPDVDPYRPIHDQLAEKDILLFYPYQSMEPFLQMLKEASTDPSVVSIKITLYRLASTSRLAEYLIAAAEAGKEVTVLMELRARFDEANNIEWAERFENAGCLVLYGFEDYKVHSKICLITRHSETGVTRDIQLGTGNYNEKTARLYTDYSLMTSNPEIGDDAATFFRNMSIGNLMGSYHTLKVAPVNLRSGILDNIDGEIAKTRAGEEGRIVFKMNSMTDLAVMRKLVEASQAGVKIDLIIRGICCLVPGIKGMTDNITVRSVVGRFLEHPRVYCFGTGSNHKIYLGSADMMTRNTTRRVEILFPVFSEELREQIIKHLEVQLSDTVKARKLLSDGTYVPIPTPDGQEPINCQEWAMKQAIIGAVTRPMTDSRHVSGRKIHEDDGRVNHSDADEALVAATADTQDELEESAGAETAADDASLEVAESEEEIAVTSAPETESDTAADTSSADVQEAQDDDASAPLAEPAPEDGAGSDTANETTDETEEAAAPDAVDASQADEKPEGHAATEEASPKSEDNESAPTAADEPAYSEQAEGADRPESGIIPVSEPAPKKRGFFARLFGRD